MQHNMLRIADAIDTIANSQPFLDYTSFLSYVTAFKIDTIPSSELIRLERLGFGATRTVYRGECPSRWENTEVAIKRLNLEIPRTKSAIATNAEELYQQLAEASLELRVLSNDLLRFHHNIVDLLAISWEEVQDEPINDHATKPSLDSVSIKPLLVVELAYPTYPTLGEYYTFARSHEETISADVRVSLLSDVADALSAIHKCAVMHGDIKPQNVLIFRRRQDGSLIAKISDFGGCYVSEEMEQTNPQLKSYTYNLAGTEYWNAPEAASREHPGFSRETRDYYSLGLLAFYILFEAMPFGDDRDSSAVNMERIAKIKDDPTEMRMLVRAKFDSCWRLAGNNEVLIELISIKGFRERHEKLQALYKSEQVNLHFSLPFFRRQC
jgi:serine/threonine protein kinase